MTYLLLSWVSCHPYLGLPIVPTEDENEKSRNATRTGKLRISAELSLPHPLTLEGWNESQSDFPDVLAVDVQQYFDNCNT